MPELPQLSFENAICMIFREECLQDFANLINVPMIRESGAETLPDMLETVIKWQNYFRKITPEKDLFEELENSPNDNIPSQYLSHFDMNTHINKTQKLLIKREKMNRLKQPTKLVPEDKLMELQPENITAAENCRGKKDHGKLCHKNQGI